MKASNEEVENGCILQSDRFYSKYFYEGFGNERRFNIKLSNLKTMKLVWTKLAVPSLSMTHLICFYVKRHCSSLIQAWYSMRVFPTAALKKNSNTSFLPSKNKSNETDDQRIQVLAWYRKRLSCCNWGYSDSHANQYKLTCLHVVQY